MTVLPGERGTSALDDVLAGWVSALTEHSVMVYALARGRYSEALACASRLRQASEPIRTIALADGVEAAVRCRRDDLATEMLQALACAAMDSELALSRGLLLRARALLAPDDTARQDFQDASVQLQLAGAAGQVARTQLLYGEWLRRRGLRREAREQLTSALTAFIALHASTFVERVEAELDATTPHRPRHAGGSLVLTSQERRVAEMAAEGATNAEIAGRLFISAHTVDYHLRKIFRKLNVTSRRELARILRSHAHSASDVTVTTALNPHPAGDLRRPAAAP